MNLMIPASAIRQINPDDPRVLDTDLATWLGMEAPRNIRLTIAANRAELQTYGDLHVANANAGKRGRPSNAYYLNEGQALVLCALSRTHKAAAVRKALIDLFMNYRAGKPYRHAAPDSNERDDVARVAHILSQFADQPKALIEVLARCVVRLDNLERHLA